MGECGNVGSRGMNECGFDHRGGENGERRTEKWWVGGWGGGIESMGFFLWGEC
jgi:hypothetical protein